MPKIHVLIVEPHEQAYYKEIKNDIVEIKKILNGDFRERIKELPYTGLYKRISSLTDNKIVFINLDDSENHCDMDISTAYKILYSSGNMLDIKAHQVELKEGVFGHLEAKTSSTWSFETEGELEKIDFTLFDGEEIELFGKARMITADIDGLEDSLEEMVGFLSNNLTKHLTGIDEFENKGLAREYFGGVAGKVGILTDFYVGGPYFNRLDMEHDALQAILKFCTEKYQMDFLIINPSLVSFKRAEELLGDTTDSNYLLREYLSEEFGFEGKDDEDAAMVLDIHSEDEEFVVQQNTDEDYEEALKELKLEFLKLKFQNKLLEQIILDDDLTINAKGLMNYFVFDSHWTIDELSVYCKEDIALILDGLTELEANGYLSKRGNTFYAENNLVQRMFEDVKEDIEKSIFEDDILDDSEFRPFTDNEVNEFMDKAKYGVDFEITDEVESISIIPTETVYLSDEEYENNLRPFLVKNILMSRKVSPLNLLPFENTPLMAVTFHSDVKMAESILQMLTLEELKAETEKVNQFGQNALTIAIRKNLSEIVELLLKSGFPLRMSDYHSSLGDVNLFALAASIHAKESIEVMLEFAGAKQIDIYPEIKTALNIASDLTDDILELYSNWIKNHKTMYLNGKRYTFQITSVELEGGHYVFREKSGIELLWGTKTRWNINEIEENNFSIKATIVEYLNDNRYIVQRVKAVD